MTNRVLISGAGSGIGRAIALKLVRRGFSPVLLGRNLDSLTETVSLLEGVDGSEHRVIVADVRDAVSIREGLVKAGIECLHAVIANAGIGGENDYGEKDRWQEVLDTNLTGSYYLLNEALPLLRTHRDEGECRHVLFISSILARLGVPGYSAYCASKAGLLGLMRSYASQLAPEQILVNAICPGWVGTAMARQGLESFAQASGKPYDEVFTEQMASVPLGRMSEPREIAEMVFFLLSRVQGSITGQTLDINNGAMMP